MYSKQINVFDLTMANSPFWNNHFYDCDDVHVRGVRIVAPDDSPNTDGWDPDSATNVLIEDSSYSGGDDCVAIKSGWDCFGVAYDKPSVNITIRNISCHGRFAGIAIGSEMSGGIDNILVQHIRFSKANGPAHIKTGQSRGGYVTNVHFEDLLIADGSPLQDGITVDAFYKAANPSCPQGWRPAAAPRMSNFTFRNIDGSKAVVTRDSIRLVGNDSQPITGVSFENVHFPAGE